MLLFVQHCCVKHPPFCLHPETIFHFSSECNKLTGLLTLLVHVFNLFNVTFSKKVFICGAGHKKARHRKWQLLNFVSCTVKLAIYVSRRNKVEVRAAMLGAEKGLSLVFIKC